VNLGNPNEITILEFATRIQSLLGSNCAIEHHDLPMDDPKQRRPDISKARQLLNWEPKVPLEEGLKLTIEYFRARELAPAAD
jgi:nucleoside-diphosphate-sugar epimerase